MHRNIFVIILVAIFLGVVIYCFGQQEKGTNVAGEEFLQFTNDFSTIGEIWGGAERDVYEAVDVDGSIAVAVGWTYSFGQGANDALINVYDAQTLKPKWRKCWGGVGEESAKSVRLYNGYIYVLGWTFSFSEGTGKAYNPDIFLVKYDTNGTMIWQRKWRTFASDWGEEVRVAKDGSIYVAGWTEGFESRADFVLLKYDPYGNLVWQKIWGTKWNERAHGMTIDPQGNIILVGEADGFGLGGLDVVVIKISPEGQLVWQKVWGGRKDEWAEEVETDAEGNIYVVGKTHSFSSEKDSDAFILKFSPDGNLVWQKIWGGSGHDGATAIDIYQGKIYVTGWTRTFFKKGSEVFLLKFDVQTGNQELQKLWGGFSDDMPYDVRVTQNGVYIVGTTHSTNDVRWENPGGISYEVSGKVIDATGNLRDVKAIEVTPNGEEVTPRGKFLGQGGIQDAFIFVTKQ